MFVKKILLDTFDYGIRNKLKIFNSLKYPGLGICITSIFSNNESDTITLQAIVLLLINGYFFIIFAVNCHRLFLEKDVPDGIFETLRWNKRNTKFLLASFVLAISMAICIVPFLFVSLPIFFNMDKSQLYFYTVKSIIMLPIGYVFSRLSLILPATAVDQNSSWSTAWAISKGYGWSLCFLVTLFPLLTGLVIDAISSTSIAAKPITAMLSIVILIYEISILSNSYKVLNVRIEATQQGTFRGLS